MSFKNLASTMNSDIIPTRPPNCDILRTNGQPCGGPCVSLVGGLNRCGYHQKVYYGGKTPKKLNKQLDKSIDISSDESEEEEFIKYSDDSESNYDELSENSADLNSVSEDDTYDESSENSYDYGNESEESSVEESNKELKRKHEPEEDMARKKQRKNNNYVLFEEFMTQNIHYKKNESISIEEMYYAMKHWMNDNLGTYNMQLPCHMYEFTEYLLSKNYLITESEECGKYLMHHF